MLLFSQVSSVLVLLRWGCWINHILIEHSFCKLSNTETKTLLEQCSNIFLLEKKTGHLLVVEREFSLPKESLSAMIQLCSQQTKLVRSAPITEKTGIRLFSLLRNDGKSAVVVKDIKMGKQTKHYSE